MTIAINGTQYNMILDTIEINSTQPPIIIPANSKLDIQPGATYTAPRNRITGVGCGDLL